MREAEILAKVATGEVTAEEASKLLAESRSTLYCKMADKGGMSLYGLQRMPVTLYVEQWERLLAMAEEIKAFLKEHESELKRKNDKDGGNGASKEGDTSS